MIAAAAAVPVAIVLIAALLPLTGLARSSRALSVLVAVGLLLGVATGASVVLSRSEHRPESAITERPTQVRTDGYVSSDTCRGCHPGAYRAWHASYHRTMTQVASPASVLGDFDARLDDHGATYRFERIGDEFRVDLPLGFGVAGLDGPRASYRVVLTTGSHHMQVYWRETELERVITSLPWVWLIDEQRWIPRISAFLRPPRETRMDVDELDRWRMVCIRCHSTHGVSQPEGPGRLNTRVGEFGIACEACHGPADEHVRANRDPLRRYGLHFGSETDETIVQPAELSPDRASQVCGSCHAVLLYRTPEDIRDYMLKGNGYRPGDDLHESVYVVRAEPAARTDPRLVRELARRHSFLDERFWPDGMIRVAGREYNGLIASPCYQTSDPERQLSCLSCHRLHKAETDPRRYEEWADDQLERGMREDGACLQCHADYQRDVTRHTHHEATSSGSRCYNCHMPFTSYGLLKAVRSHQIDSPSVVAGAATGRPNACNQCHLDKTLGWTADRLADWYGLPRPELDADERSIAAGALWTLRGDAGQRALMAWSFGWEAARQASGTSWMAPYLAELLADPYDAVRLIADRTLRALPELEAPAYGPFTSAEARRGAVDGLFRRWEQTRPALDAETAGAVLLGPDGTLQREAFQRLLARRDTRKLYLAE